MVGKHGRAARTRGVAIGAALALALASRGALAQSAQSAPIGEEAPAADGTGDEVAAAKRWYEIGRTAYVRGDYSSAASAFRAAHEISGEPRLLFNLAQALRLGGSCGEALAYYERYRSLVSELPSDFERLRSEAGRCNEARSKPSAAADASASSRPAPAIPEVTPRVEPPEAPKPKVEPREVTPKTIDSGWGWTRWTGLAGISIASGAAAAGAVFALRAQQAAEETKNVSRSGGAWSDGARENEEAGQRASTWALGLFATAIVSGGVGLALLVAPGERNHAAFRGPTRPAPRAIPALTVNASSSGAALTWRGAF